MPYNPLAEELNATIQKNPNIYAMLSELGRKIFFPKGILSQSAEAKEKAHKFNATIGIATEGDGPMYLPVIHQYFQGLNPKDLYPYAPASGRPDLRQAWKEKIIAENPNLKDKYFSLPLVTNALTHGLNHVAELFCDTGDIIILPDQFWGNYRLTFAVRREGEIKTFSTFTKAGGFNVNAFASALQENSAKGKLIIILNFPNNPSGYTPTPEEGTGLVKAIKETAQKGCNIIVTCDDAYFGLFYDDRCMKESIFCDLADLDERVLAVKLDGATKEEFVWGFRCGFISFACKNTPPEVFEAISKKVMGLTRGSISNCPHPSQTIVLKALKSRELQAQKKQKWEIMKARAEKVHEVLANPKYNEAWDVYPFNSGYFMCLKLKTVEAEPLRKYLLDKYGVGIIASTKFDIRIAFSCLEVKNIEEVFEIIYKGVKDLEN